MQKQNDLAENLLNLFEPNSYREFGENFFVNKPLMTGYYYIFKKLTEPKFCLILNSSKQPYPSNLARIGDYIYIIFNVASLEEFLGNLPDKYFETLLNLMDQNVQKKNERNMPYGYYLDENGETKIDPKKALEVKKVYQRYIETESVRDIADEMRTNFSHIRDILHANEEYLQMNPKIISTPLIKKVNELLGANVKGTFRKMTFQDKIKEVRKRRKERENLQGSN